VPVSITLAAVVFAEGEGNLTNFHLKEQALRSVNEYRFSTGTLPSNEPSMGCGVIYTGDHISFMVK